MELAGNRLKAFPTPLAHLGSLESADLSGNGLTGLPDIVGDCKALELNLNRNQISGLNAVALSRCPRLKVRLTFDTNVLALCLTHLTRPQM